MVRIKLPHDLPSYSEIIDMCCSINTHYRNDVLSNKQYLLNIGNDYKTYARLNDLYCFNTILPNNPNEVICNTLSTFHMVKLYNYCLRDKRSGNVYDKLLTFAKDPEIQCPFCGGISEPSQLDHFLPKSRYGHFSVFQYNLIPICTDCNTQFKKEFYPKLKNNQLIHPYLDDDCFFNEQWLYAEYIDDGTELGTINYSVNPPNTWSDDKKEKILFHFETFNLANRFATKSVSDLSDMLITMKKYKGIISMDDFVKCSIDSILETESKVNHWKKAFLQAVKDKISVIWGRM